MREAVKEAFELSEKEWKERLPSINQTVVNNRVGWVRTYLNKAGLLTILDGGMVQITDRGQDALSMGRPTVVLNSLMEAGQNPAPTGRTFKFSFI